jgi:hypothetical protein
MLCRRSWLASRVVGRAVIATIVAKSFTGLAHE